MSTTKPHTNVWVQADVQSRRPSPDPTRYTVEDRSGARGQRLHAFAILVVPAIAVCVAAWDATHGRVHLWQPLLAAVFYVLTFLAITVGFHRLFSHRAFQSHPWVAGGLAILGSMAAQGPVIYWVANHRRHHRFGDISGDPHSPIVAEEQEMTGWAGFWHAHAGWTFDPHVSNQAVFCKDLLRDPQLVWINRHYLMWVGLGLLIPTAIGAALGRSLDAAWAGLLWGGGVRLFFSYHLTNSINSVTHMFGYRTFATPDQSRNNLWLGLPTLGEGWHNNHHAAPASAIFGLAWWEVDFGGLLIRILERMGLVWQVHRPGPRVLDSQIRATADARANTEDAR